MEKSITLNSKGSVERAFHPRGQIFPTLASPTLRAAALTEFRAESSSTLSAQLLVYTRVPKGETSTLNTPYAHTVAGLDDRYDCIHSHSARRSPHPHCGWAWLRWGGGAGACAVRTAATQCSTHTHTGEGPGGHGRVPDHSTEPLTAPSLCGPREPEASLDKYKQPPGCWLHLSFRSY